MPTLGFWSLLLLFLCAAAWTIAAVAIGGFCFLWAAHVGRTGAHPLPKAPAISFLRRKPADDDDGPGDNNGRAKRHVGIGP